METVADKNYPVVRNMVIISGMRMKMNGTTGMMSGCIVSRMVIGTASGAAVSGFVIGTAAVHVMSGLMSGTTDSSVRFPGKRLTLSHVPVKSVVVKRIETIFRVVERDMARTVNPLGSPARRSLVVEFRHIARTRKMRNPVPTGMRSLRNVRLIVGRCVNLRAGDMRLRMGLRMCSAAVLTVVLGESVTRKAENGNHAKTR